MIMLAVFSIKGDAKIRFRMRSLSFKRVLFLRLNGRVSVISLQVSRMIWSCFSSVFSLNYTPEI